MSNFIKKMVALIGIVGISYLTIFSTLYTVSFYFESESGGYYKEQFQGLVSDSDSVFVHALFWLMIFGVFFLLRKRIVNIKVSHVDKGIYGVAILLTTLGIIWSLMTEVSIIHDSIMVYDAAEKMIAGDLSPFDYWGYFHRYPHQLSLVHMFETFMRLGIQESHKFLYILNSIALGLFTIASYRVLKLLTCSTVAYVAYGGIQLACAPLFLYTSFAYGEVISISCTMWAVYASMLFFQSIEKRKSWKYLVLLAAVLTIGYYVRTNMLIIFVAIACTLILVLLEKRIWWKLWIIVPLIIAYGIPNILVSSAYGEYMEGYDATPSIAWISMGMLEGEYGFGPGGYNSTLYYDFRETTEESTAVLLERMEERVGDFLSNPSYALTFYHNKLMWQWMNPDFLSLEHTSHFEEEPNEFIQQLYYGDLREPWFQFMNLYQSAILLLGLLAFGILLISKRQGSEYLILIIFIGGFLFSILWEAKPRYPLPYFVILLPVAANALSVIIRKVEEYVK